MFSSAMCYDKLFSDATEFMFTALKPANDVE